MENKTDFPKQGEIWNVNYTYKFSELHDKGSQIESQIKKLRPSIVISKNLYNENRDELIVLPLTDLDGDSLSDLFEVEIKKDQLNGLDKDSKALIDQPRVINKEYRLGKFIGSISLLTLEEIIEKFTSLFNDKI